MDRRAVTAKRTVAVIIGFAISAAGLYFALRGLTWSGFEAQIHTIDWRWVMLAALFDTLSYVAQGFRWGALLEREASWKTAETTTRAVYVGLFLNEVFPFRPGEAIRVWLAARKLDRGLWSVVPTVAVERLMDGFWLAIALVGASLFMPLPSVLSKHVGWLLVIIALILFALWVLSRTWLAKYRLSWSGRAWLFSAAALVGQGFAFWAAIRANHLLFAPAAAFAVMLIVRVGTLLPAAPANLGTHQFATVWGLTFFGVPQQIAAAASLVIFANLTIPLLLIGAAMCLSEGLSFGAIREMDRAVSEPAIQPGS